MVDFKIYNDEVFLLEITPRAGGDCLPFLIRESSGLDIFSTVMDLAEGKEVSVSDENSWKTLVGLTLIAETGGILKTLSLPEDPRIFKHIFKSSQGEVIKMPPEDFRSRILGYVLFRPDPEGSIEEQCRDISRKIVIEIE